jgi:hypothetical protein
MDNKKKIPNGGFPPIKICLKNNKESIKKFREFQSENINIKEILSKKINKKILDSDKNDEDLEIIDTI